MDSGGATVNACIGKLVKKAPFRLAQVVPPESKAFCFLHSNEQLLTESGRRSGATLVNQIFADNLRQWLTPKRAELEQPEAGRTIETIIHGQIMPYFENIIKRNADPQDICSCTHSIELVNLKADPQNSMFQEGRLHITK
jgi:hypothetical protein